MSQGVLYEFVVSVSIPKFTEIDAEYIEVVDSACRVSLAKTLVMNADGCELKEGITVTFKMAS